MIFLPSHNCYEVDSTQNNIKWLDSTSEYRSISRGIEPKKKSQLSDQDSSKYGAYVSNTERRMKALSQKLVWIFFESIHCYL